MLQRPRRRCEGAAMGAINLDLRPGGGLGPFSLGIPICEAFAHAEQYPRIYDVVHVKYHDEKLNLKERPLQVGDFISVARSKWRDPCWRLRSQKSRKDNHGHNTRLRLLLSVLYGSVITGAQKFLKFGPQEPLRLDLVISFPDHGFHLRFEPRSQRLRLIEVFDVQRLQMHYATSFIGGPNAPATFVAVYALFGPTFPGCYDADRGIYTLFYPGLSFAFPIPSQYAECCQDREAELPLEFPDGTTPVTSRVCIYDSSIGGGVGVGVGALLKKAIPPQLVVGSLYMEEVHAKLADELWFAVGGQHIPFGASPQDVWTELGRPCGIHQKQVDQMVIHSASDPRPKTTLCGDYFYNYFTRGLDILFDGQTHKIKKFVLHTNFPGHADFNSYIKCNFVIHCLHLSPQHSKANAYEHCIRPDTKWHQVKELLGDGGRAAIQTQGSTSNPFGSTFVYGYQNIAFEVMKNGHIATVTLFQS